MSSPLNRNPVPWTCDVTWIQKELGQCPIETIIKAPVCVHPDHLLPFEVHPDASEEEL